MMKKALTLTELLISIAIIVLLILILLPALKRARDNRIRAACANNLRQIGQAMFIYSNDYDDYFPRAAGPNSIWGTTPNWHADNRAEAFALDDGPGAASISASFYLLVKHSDAPPEFFMCPTDTSATEFIPADYGVRNRELVDLWDFGPNPSDHVSYAYHLPYGPYPLRPTNPPGMAVAADRSPWLEAPGYPVRPPSDLAAFDPGGAGKTLKQANSLIHQQDGQNVVFNDGHAAFETTGDCGLKNDNIYTSHNGPDIQRGTPPRLESQPADANDSLLVHDPPLKAGK